MNPQEGSASAPDLVRALATSLSDPGLMLLERRPSPYRSTFPLEELVIRLRDGSRRTLVFKDLSRPGPDGAAWQIKARFLHDPLREIEVYRDVLGPSGLSSPGCAATVIEPERGRYWLFLEKVEGKLLWQIGEMEVWGHIAEWLADMHTRFASRTNALPARLLVHDREYYQRWIERARRFGRWPVDSNQSGREIDWLAGCCERIVDWLIEQPVTFLHGEFYPSNVIVETSADGIRVRPVDWEMAGLGTGIVDLAALTSGAWSEEDRRRLVSAYREALPSEVRPTPEDLKESLDRCRLLLAVQWLGWSTGWTPPLEHDHDWMAAAIGLAEALET